MAQMETAMVNGMAETVSLDETNARNAFYSSPLGTSAVSKMNPVMQPVMFSTGPAVQQMQTRLTQRLQDAFAQQGRGRTGPYAG